MLFKLSLKNIKKSIKDYSIYFFTLVIAVAIFYVFNSIDSQSSFVALNKDKRDMVKALVVIIDYVSVFVSIVLGFLIIYSNNFLIKRRKKELGLYLTLGMSKTKVSLILVVETLVVGIISLVVGLLLGVFISQFISIFIAYLFQANMSRFHFIFSAASLSKTIIYFSIIFLLVMIFNVMMLSRHKLINLLTASSKNEKIKIRNKYITIVAFVLAIVCLGYAYKLLLYSKVLFTLSGDVLKMLVSGALGTFLLFFSLSGFFLKIIEKSKKIYYKNLNMFVLKQINNKINTSVISTTIISLMLLLTIGILSGSLSIASAFNSDLKENNLTDFTLYENYSLYSRYLDDGKSVHFEQLTSDQNFAKYVKEYAVFSQYTTPSITIDNMVDDTSREEIKKSFGIDAMLNSPVVIMLESDYQKLMNIFDQNVTDITDNEYLVLLNMDSIIEYYNPSLKNGNTLNIGNSTLTPKIDHAIETAITNYNTAGNDGVIVVSDKYKDELEFDIKIMVGNYVKTNNVENLEEDFITYLLNMESSKNLLRTKLMMESSSTGISAIMTFLGLYLGIIFALSSATVLAIGQLSESSDNKERYRVLRQLGTSEPMIKKALFTQIFIVFALPLVVALIHAIFGLKEINRIIALVASMDLTTNIILTSIFIVVVYGGYFLITYICSKNIIKEN